MSICFLLSLCTCCSSYAFNCWCTACI